MSDPLEDLLSSKPMRIDGCVVCGEDETARVTVTINEHVKAGEDRDGPPRSRSSGRNYCSQHGVNVYAELVDGLDADLREKT